jgi:hypothetical protein
VRFRNGVHTDPDAGQFHCEREPALQDCSHLFLSQRAAAGAADAVQLKEAAISIMIAIGITSSSEVSGTVTVSPHIDSLAFFQQVCMFRVTCSAAVCTHTLRCRPSCRSCSLQLLALPPAPFSLLPPSSLSSLSVTRWAGEAAPHFPRQFNSTLPSPCPSLPPRSMNLPAVLGLITPHLSNPHYVVHTYAAFAITRMLDTKVPKAAGGVPEPLINSATFAPFFGATVGGLFAVRCHV